MTTTRTVKLSTKQYAALAGRSVRTIQRWCVRGWVPASKVRGSWIVTLTPTEFRFAKRFLVDTENRLTREIMATDWSKNIDGLIAKKDAVRETLELLGCGDIVLAIDHAKIWRGRKDKYGRSISARAFAELDRLVAA